MKTFIESQFSYSPLTWMFYDRSINNTINKVHERALRIVYQDDTSSFEELLIRDKSFTVHHRNIQNLALEVYKAEHDISPKVMKSLFVPKHSSKNNLRSERILSLPSVNTVHYGKDSIRYFGAIVWNMLPNSIKKQETFGDFKKEIKKWLPKCSCRLCKDYIAGVGYIKIVESI